MARTPRFVMSVPLIITWPESGRSSPRRCLRKTDLPPPLRPMITVMERSGMSRSMPRRTGWAPNDFVSPRTLITTRDAFSREDRAQEVVPDEDEDGGQDDRLRGGAGHPFGAVADVEPLVGGDPGHDGAEGQRLPEAGHHVGEVDERSHLAEVGSLAEAEQLHAHQIPAEDADDVEEGRHQRERHDAGQDRRRDQIAERHESPHG